MASRPKNCPLRGKLTPLIDMILFLLSLLREVGHQPILKTCANCKTRIENRASSIENPVYFSSIANGLICRDCEASFPDRIKLSKAAAACLTDLKQLADANPKTLTEIEKILINHLTQTLGHHLKMPKHILKTH